MKHYDYLSRALQLAKLRKGFTAPNPPVGAIIVKDNQIIAEGHHEAPGQSHAEVVACSKAGVDFTDAILYVTLEPCCHWGRTPPCTDIIIHKGIKEVYYGFEDPNPKVSGGGKKQLQAQGIKCQRISHSGIDEFYRSYQHWIINQKPWVTSKLAITLDGKIAGPESRPVRITGQEAALFTHEGRKKADGILTTVRTIIQDDPLLNVRLNEINIAKQLFVLDTHLKLPVNARILQSAKSVTVFHSSQDTQKLEVLTELGVHCIYIPSSDSRLDLHQVLNEIGKCGIHDLWIEAGGTLFTTLVQQGLTNKSYIYIAPKLLGSNSLSAFNTQNDMLANAKHVSWFQLGQDSICEILW